MYDIIKYFLLFVLTALPGIAAAQYPGTYTADSDTLHLYHFDSDGSDSVGSLNLTIADGASLESSINGFGNAVNTYDGTTGSSPYAGDTVNKTLISNLVGSDGAFTFEAIVKPMVSQSSIPNHMEIISLEDSDGNSERGFQFRINTDGTLRFQTLAGIVTNFNSAITFTAGTWYHVAVTYNGQENTTDNLKLYWTEIDANSTVQQVGSFQLSADLTSDVDGYFAVGNELRATGGYSENFEGVIDEVRISQVARTESELLYILYEGLPSIIEHPENIKCQAGQTASLECRFTAETLGRANWYKSDDTEDLMLQNTDTNISISLDYDTDTMEYTSSLTIDNCEISDMGNYYLAVSNDSDQVIYSNKAALTVQGLFAHWTLDQTDFTGTYYTESIAGKNAEVESVPAFTIGANQESNGAVEINSTGGWAVADSDNSIVLPNTFTISFWANWQDQTNTGDDLYIDSGIGNKISIANGIKSQTWQHICTVFEDNTCKLYIDGILTAQSEWDIPQEMTAELYIGSAEMGTEIFNGQLDDIRIYNYAMNDTEVAQLRFDFAALRSCINSYSSSVDWSGPQNTPDCKIDIYDLDAFAGQYLGTNELYDISGPGSRPDGIVSLFDFAQLSFAWLDCGLFPNCL